MKKAVHKPLLLCCCIILFQIMYVQAQELIYELPLPVQVSNSDHIIEGQVIAKSSFWDNTQSNIYTHNTIEVYKQFKGGAITEIINIVTPGGTVGHKTEIVTPSLDLHVGDIGVFMIRNNGLTNTFIPVGSTQGFYKYDLSRNIVYNPFIAIEGISENFYNSIKGLTNQNNILEISAFDLDAVIQAEAWRRSVNGIVEITSFSPTTLNAGVGDVLTITGNGFGTDIGTVEFRDANFGGENDMGPVYFTALEGQILNWNNTEIQVEVPSRAGTGDIRVTPLVGAPVISNEELTIFFAQINASSETDAFQTQHFDTNGSGGYTWQMHTEFDANILAKASFNRAFDSWVCTTGMNWEIGPVTAIDVIAEDGINIIRFDNGEELPLGVLGRTSTRFESCENLESPNGVAIVVTELDIVFNDEFTGALSALSWEFGPDLAGGVEVDFETVAVHELGHAHQLAHIINPGDIMHFSTSIAQNSRTLGASDLAGGIDVMERNVNAPVCDLNAMTLSKCSTLNLSEVDFGTSISIVPNPVSTQLTIATQNSIQLKSVVIYDAQGRMVASKQFQNAIENTIDVSTLASGAYLIKIITEYRSVSKILIVD